MNQKVLILGFGIASTAYASILNYKKIKTTVLGSPFDNLKIKKLKNTRTNIYSNINFILDDSYENLKKSSFDLIIVGTNSSGLNWVVERLNKLKIKSPVLLITKGLIKNGKSISTISSFFEKNCFNKNIIMAAGPCLASELIKKNHTRTIFASNKIRYAKLAKKILETDYYHPDLTTDIVGSQFCSAVKNIYATVVGSSKAFKKNTPGKNDYFNSSSALFEQSLKEIAIIVKKFKGRSDTVLGLAGAGDLYVSVLGGRNSKLGYYLGKGYTYKSVIKNQMRGVTVEGADITLSMSKLIIQKVGRNKLPLLQSLSNSILLNKKLKINWKMFTH